MANSGDGNSGNWNSGDWNSGSGNSGSGNSGSRNSGSRNSGYGNSGYGNSGYGNSGYWNSGSGNSGGGNSGYGNSGSRNSGWFNTDEPNARFFGKGTTIKLSEFENSECCPSWSGFELTEWIESSNMSEREKREHPKHEMCGGYLKMYEYKEAWANFWKATTEENRQKFLNLPNFDAKIFEEITGIDVGQKAVSLSGKEVSVTIDGKTYTAIVK